HNICLSCLDHLLSLLASSLRKRRVSVKHFFVARVRNEHERPFDLLRVVSLSNHEHDHNLTASR
ncbi:MAG: hypothetical protein ACREP8_00030, partial [Candidatus Binatia bacterium]